MCVYVESGPADAASRHTTPQSTTLGLHPVIHVPIIAWITTHLPTSEGWMAELAKARSMQPYIILYKTTLQLGVSNLPKVFSTRQRPGLESNRVSVIH